MNIQSIALIGAGAIGAVYASHLHKHYGSSFAVIASGDRANRLQNNGITINGDTFFPRVVTGKEDGFAADLILVCVKNYHLNDAIRDIAPFVGESAIILPLLNGITARDRLLEHFPANHILYGLAIYIDAVRTAEGVVNTNDGIIQLGDALNDPPSPPVMAVSEALSRAGIGVEVCPDMIRTIWRKWMLNVGCNQVSALIRGTYSAFSSSPAARDLFFDAMMEVVSLAKAADVNLTEADAREFVSLMQTFSPNGKTSMLQDVESLRKTEVESFGGTVCELGKRYGVPTPVNDMLTRLITATEQAYLVR